MCIDAHRGSGEGESRMKSKLSRSVLHVVFVLELPLSDFTSRQALLYTAKPFASHIFPSQSVASFCANYFSASLCAFGVRVCEPLLVSRRPPPCDKWQQVHKEEIIISLGGMESEARITRRRRRWPGKERTQSE
jgi:hypothetical protein